MNDHILITTNAGILSIFMVKMGAFVAIRKLDITICVRQSAVEALLL